MYLLHQKREEKALGVVGSRRRVQGPYLSCCSEFSSEIRAFSVATADCLIPRAPHTAASMLRGPPHLFFQPLVTARVPRGSVRLEGCRWHLVSTLQLCTRRGGWPSIGAQYREGCSASCSLSRCLSRPGLEKIGGLVLQRAPQVHPAPEDPRPDG